MHRCAALRCSPERIYGAFCGTLLDLILFDEILKLSLAKINMQEAAVRAERFADRQGLRSIRQPAVPRISQVKDKL